MNTDAPIRSEIILHEDGNFYRRDVRESIIQDVSSAIKDSLNDSSYMHNLLPVGNVTVEQDIDGFKAKFNHPYMISTNTSNGVQISKTFHAFIKLIDGFPFPKAALVRNDVASEVAGTDQHNIVPLQYYNRNTEEEDQVGVNAWYNNTDYDMFVCIKDLSMRATNAPHLRGTNIVPTAYLFGIHKDNNQVVTFNLPNIFDDGRICTGVDFCDTSERIYKAHDLHEYLTRLVTCLHEAPFNNDLRRQDVDEHHLIVSSEGFCAPSTLRQAYHNAVVPDRLSETTYNSFFQPITNELLLDFATCLKSSKS